MNSTEDILDKATKDMDRIASIIAAYYAALLSNGIDKETAGKLTEGLQAIWFRKTLGIPYVVQKNYE